MTILDFKELLGLTVPLPHEEEADFQTLGGFVMTQFGRIPKAGDHFTWEGWRFEVMDMDRHRVDKVMVTPPAPESAEQAAIA